MTQRTCSIDGCERKHLANGLCNMHRQRQERGASLQSPPRAMGLTVEERFWPKVDKTGGPNACWIWTAARSRRGYGYLTINARTYKAHRVSFEWANGPIPPGQLIDHICHVPACVNPSHLRLATQKQNGEHRVGPNRNGTSGVRGVHWEKRRKKWEAYVYHHRHRIALGYFGTIEEAAEAVRLKRIELFTHNNLDRADASA